jgi:UDP-glucuronate 4-epimerase
VERAAQEQGDVRDTGADTTRARQQLGFEPAVDIEAGLSMQFEWTRGAEEQLLTGGAPVA